jgi:hypothetical protein
VPWEFEYSYGIHCAKLTNGPANGRCFYFEDDGCSQEIRYGMVGEAVHAWVGGGEIKCWKCETW